jgi:hypothetical protein
MKDEIFDSLIKGWIEESYEDYIMQNIKEHFFII